MKAGTALTTEDTEDTESGRATKQLRQLGRFVEHHVRQHVAQGMRSEAVGYSASPCSGIAAGEDVNARVAHNQGLLRPARHFPQDGLRPLRIGFLSRKAVAAVNPGKEFTQAQRLDNG